MITAMIRIVNSFSFHPFRYVTLCYLSPGSVTPDPWVPHDAAPGDYTAYPNMDCNFDDLPQPTCKPHGNCSIDELETLCNSKGNCIGFNRPGNILKSACDGWKSVPPGSSTFYFKPGKWNRRQRHSTACTLNLPTTAPSQLYHVAPVLCCLLAYPSCSSTGYKRPS